MASLPCKSLRDRVRAMFKSKRREKQMCSYGHHVPQENAQEPENDVCLVPGPSTDLNLPSTSKPSRVTAAMKYDNRVAGQAVSNPQISLSLESFSLLSTHTISSSLERLYQKYKAENEKRLQNPKQAIDVDTARPALRYKISRDSTIMSLPSLGSEEEVVDFARPGVVEDDARRRRELDGNARLKDNPTQEEFVTLPVGGQCWLMENTSKSIDNTVLRTSEEKTVVPEENKTKEAAGEQHKNIKDSQIIIEGQKFRLSISDKILIIDGSLEEMFAQRQLSVNDVGAPVASTSGGLGVGILCGNVHQGTGINISGENVYVNVWDTAAGMKPYGAEGACDLSKKVNECSSFTDEQIRTDCNEVEDAQFRKCNIQSGLRRVADIRSDLHKFKDTEPYLQKYKDNQSGLQKFEDIQPNLREGIAIPEELNKSEKIPSDLSKVENGSCDPASKGSCAVAAMAREQALTTAESHISPEAATGSESFCTAKDSLPPDSKVLAMKSLKQPLNCIAGTVNDVCERQAVSAVPFSRSLDPACNVERQNFPEEAGTSSDYKADARRDNLIKIMIDESCEVCADSWSFGTPQVKDISGSGSSDLVSGNELCNVCEGLDSRGLFDSNDDSVIDSRLRSSGFSGSGLSSTDECQNKEIYNQGLIHPEDEGQTEVSDPKPREGEQLGEEQTLVESSQPEASGLGSSGDISDTLTMSAKLNDTRDSNSIADDCGLIDVYTFKQKIHHETGKLNKLFNKYKSRELRIERLLKYLDQLKREKEEMTRLLQGVDQETAALRQEASDLRCTVTAVCDTSVASIGKETEAKRLEPACYRRYSNIRTPADASNALLSVRNRIRALNDLEVLIYRKQLMLLHVLPSTHQDKTPPTKVVLPIHKISKSKKSDPASGNLASGSSIVIEIVSEANNRTEEVTRTDSAITISTPLSMSNDDTASGANKRVSRV